MLPVAEKIIKVMGLPNWKDYDENQIGEFETNPFSECTYFGIHQDIVCI